MHYENLLTSISSVLLAAAGLAVILGKRRFSGTLAAWAVIVIAIGPTVMSQTNLILANVSTPVVGFALLCLLLSPLVAGLVAIGVLQLIASPFLGRRGASEMGIRLAVILVVSLYMPWVQPRRRP